MKNTVLIVIGILVLLVVLFIILSAAASLLFEQKANDEARGLFEETELSEDIITPEDLEGLPFPVQKWLDNSQVIGKERIAAVRLQQKGLLKTAPDKAWMPFYAEQYFSTDKPGFVWKAKIKAAPFFHIAGRDKYKDGKGNMQIKVLSLFTAADSSGKEIDQGTMVRYLAEMMWFPSAALNDYIRWEGIDERSARAVMSYGDVSASIEFFFDENGDINRFSAQRYGEFDGQYSLETWSGSVGAFKIMDGVRVPSQGNVTWELETGDFTWLEWEITTIEYNKTEVY